MSEFYGGMSDCECESVVRPRILNLQQFVSNDFASCNDMRDKCVIIYYGKSMEFIKKRESYRPNIIWVRAEQPQAIYDCLARARNGNGRDYVLVVDTSFSPLRSIVDEID